MARVDDYRNAVEIARVDLQNKDAERVAAWSGARVRRKPEGTRLSLKVLGRTLEMSWPDCRMLGDPESGEISLQEQVLILHYLIGSEGARLAHEWIAYQEVPDGRFYLDAFLRRAKSPMVGTFGDAPHRLQELAMARYDARPSEDGDVSVVVPAFPLVPVQLILWQGDDEFPPEGTILFDRSISGILSAEDVAWLAGMVIYPLIGMARSQG